MNKRVVGLVCVRANMANWNADFNKAPKQNLMGEYYGSDKALKYSMRNYWYNQDENVLIFKTYKEKDNKLAVNELKDRYSNLFLNKGESLESGTSTVEIAKNVFSCIDVKNFGATVAIGLGGKKDKKSEETGINISITGAVQIGAGMNKYEDAEHEESIILSPFSVNDKNNSTLGSMVLMTEGHYVYPFTINPANYKKFIELGYTEGYTEEDYKRFKEASLVCATALNTCSKEGCENELSIFVEVDEDVTLPNLSQYVTYEKKDGRHVYTLNFEPLIDNLGDRVQNIEIYYNTIDMDIKHSLRNAKEYDIYTKKEVK